MPFFFFLLSSLFFSVMPLHAEGLSPAQAKIQLLETLKCAACDLTGLDLSGLDLSGAQLEQANLSGANLRETNLRGANLQGAIMHGLDLSDTLLGGANLKNADLSDIDIDEMFESTEIIGTLLEGARFKDGVICGPAPTKGGWGCQQL